MTDMQETLVYMLMLTTLDLNSMFMVTQILM